MQDGDFALLMTAQDGRAEIVSLLLDAGVNIDLQSKVHVTEHIQGGVVHQEVCPDLNCLLL